MEKINFEQIDEINIDDVIDIGVYNIKGIDYIILGGELTARGCVNFLRPYDKAKDKLHNRQYACSKCDVVYYMDNENTSMLLDVVKDLRYDMERQKW